MGATEEVCVSREGIWLNKLCSEEGRGVMQHKGFPMCREPGAGRLHLEKRTVTYKTSAQQP